MKFPHAPFRPGPALLAGVLAALAAGCSHRVDPLAYTRNEFSQTDTYTRTYASPPETVCEAGRRALLSQGYTLGESGPRSTEGRKQFQSAENYKEITFRLVCEPDHAAERRSLAFVNAVESTFALKKTNNSASLGVGLLGSVSMPFTSSDDSMVKVGSETITADPFYGRFFALLEKYIPSAPPAAGPAHGDAGAAPAGRPAPPAPERPRAP